MRLLVLFLSLLFTGITSAQNLNNKKDTIPDTESAINKALKQNYTTLDNLKDKEEYLLLIKSKSYKIGFSKGILQSGDLLMAVYSQQGNYKKAIQIGTELKKVHIEDENARSIMASIYQRNAHALNALGFYEAGLKDFKTAIMYAEKMEDKSLGLYYTSLCYENMTGYFHNKIYQNQENYDKMYDDSIVYYLTKSIEAIKKIKDDAGGLVTNDLKYDGLAFTHLRFGVFYLERSELESAEIHLLEAYAIHNNTAYHIPGSDKVLLLNQLSWLYMEKKDYQKSIEYAKSALELEKQFRDPHNRVESFEFLAYSYTEIGDREKAAKYMRDYSWLKDSIRIAERNNADTAMETVITDVKNVHKKNLQKLSVYVLIIAFIATMAMYLFWKRRNKSLQKKYETIISQIRSETKGTDKKNNWKSEIEVTKDTKEIIESNEPKSTIDIPVETLQVLISRLEKFEKSKLYLRKDLNRPWLTTHLNTNSKYLFDVIKNYRGKNFADYINGLRIEYIMRKLVEDPKYKEYKIEYLAEDCGFNSRQVFINAFKKETGLTPSYFIENLKKK